MSSLQLAAYIYSVKEFLSMMKNQTFNDDHFAMSVSR